MPKIDPRETPARVRIANLETAVKDAAENWDELLFGTPEWAGIDGVTFDAVRPVGVVRWAGEEEAVDVYVGNLETTVYVVEVFPGYFFVDADCDYAEYVAKIVRMAENDPADLPATGLLYLPV